MKKLSSKVRPAVLCLSLMTIGLVSCKNNSKSEPEKEPETITSADEKSEKDLFFDISLAEWSLHKPINAGELSPMDFAERANELGFDGIEYVSAFYQPYYEDAENPEAAFQKMLDTLKAKSEKYNVENVLIMVDAEGALAVSDEGKRNQAVENHKKWVDAADFLGAHSIRVNLRGSKDPEEWKNNSVDALTKLGEYAATKNIGVIVENHGGLSSNAEMLVAVMDRVNLPNVGTLPDFGNFCIEGSIHDCKEKYPRYKGVKQMMPYAKGVSAKSYNFNEAGEETKMDYSKLLQIVKDAGYTGFIGIEYEGTELPPKEGILATKALLIEAGSKL
ncbi:MAG TPA: sugar phosphate isomerase/epimerase family protein [Salinimicrobium sp.]|nr:sugar phosphate isomerase/epimerase family protein [Salinimicrobium sp.]